MPKSKIIILFILFFLLTTSLVILGGCRRTKYIPDTSSPSSALNQVINDANSKGATAKSEPPADINEEITLESSQPLAPQVIEPKPSVTPGQIRGSCNQVELASNCFDYIGSYWTESTMRTQCADGRFSRQPCPLVGGEGGCRMGAGSLMEFIVWYYTIGGNPGEVGFLESTRQACLYTPGAQWEAVSSVLEEER